MDREKSAEAILGEDFTEGPNLKAEGNLNLDWNQVAAGPLKCGHLLGSGGTESLLAPRLRAAIPSAKRNYPNQAG